MVSCLMGDSTALASAIVRCCLNKADTGAEAVVCLGVDFGKYLT